MQPDVTVPDGAASPGAQLAALIRPSIRSIRWGVPAGAGVLTAALLVLKHEQLRSPPTALGWVRGCALLLTLGALPLLDDPAAKQVEAVPLALAMRSAIRLAGFAGLVLLPVLALAFATNLPAGALLLEASTIAVPACAASLLLTASDHPEPSTVVSSALLPLPALLSILPPRAALLVPQGAQWTGAHQRWALLLVVGIVALAAALRDPANCPKRPPASILG